MIKIERAEATFGVGNQKWETFLVVTSYKEASEQLVKLINDNDAIGDFFRVVEITTPPEDQHSREPDKVKPECDNCVFQQKVVKGECLSPFACKHQQREVKPLAQYLGEYLFHEDHTYTNDCDEKVIGLTPTGMVEILEQALDAYESTEQVKIRIEPI